MELEKEKLHVIVLADGTTLDNLRLNGNNYVSGRSREDLLAVLDGNLRPVVIDGETREEAELIHVTSRPNGETWFTLRDMPEAKKVERKNRADIEYLAMMTDNELEEEV